MFEPERMLVRNASENWDSSGNLSELCTIRASVGLLLSRYAVELLVLPPKKLEVPLTFLLPEFIGLNTLGFELFDRSSSCLIVLTCWLPLILLMSSLYLYLSLFCSFNPSKIYMLSFSNYLLSACNLLFFCFSWEIDDWIWAMFLSISLILSVDMPFGSLCFWSLLNFLRFLTSVWSWSFTMFASRT